MFRGALFLSLLASSTACTVDPIDLRDRPCPCVDGFACVSERCVPIEDAGGRDAAPDAPLDLAMADGGLDLGRDASPADLGADAGSDAGRLEGCEAEIGRRVLLCDDFESALTEWTRVEEFGSATRVDRAGGFAARLQTTTSAGRAAIHRAIPPTSTGKLWARAWVRVPAPAITSPLRERDAVSVGTSTERHVRVVAGDEGRLGYAVGAASDFAASPAPLESGACVRLEIDLAPDASGQATLYLGDTEVARLIDLPTLPSAGSIDRVWTGVAEVDGPIALEVDDLAVDTTELHCP